MKTKIIKKVPDQKTKQDYRRVYKIFSISIGICFLIITLYFFNKNTRIGLNNSIIEQHGFRQTQTGITAYYFLKDGFKIDYETPMFGYPWKVPMEFPAYQYFVSLFKKTSTFSLDKSGRIVSLIFFYLSLIPIYLISRYWTKECLTGILVIIIALVHPLIIYWSRSFLIESTALFFNLLYVLVGLYLLKYKNIILYLIILSLGIISPIIKTTTGATHVILLGLFYLKDFIENFSSKDIINLLKKYTLKGFVFFVPPLLSIIFWTSYTDNIKDQNFTSSFWSSNDPNMKTWNYGTIQQKLSLDVWSQIDGFEFHYLLMVIGLSILAFVLKLKNKYEILIFSIAGLSGPLLFTNLYYVHDYYSYSNALFYCFAFGFFFSNLIFEKKELYFKIIGIIASISLIVYSSNSYKNSFYLALQKRNNNYFQYIGENLKPLLKENEAFIFFGMIGDPFVPYYSERKGVCMSGYYVEQMKKDTLGFLKKIEPSNIKAMVVCDVSNQDMKLLQKTIDYFKLNPQPANNDYQQWGYYIFLKK